MSERPMLWLAAVLALLVVTVVQVHTLLALFRTHRDLSERFAAESRAAVRRAVEEQRPVFERGTVADWPRALIQARREAGASELELFDLDGTPLAADPEAAPVEHWPSPADVERARTSMVDYGPVGSPVPRLLHYVGLESRGRPLLLRFATAAPEVAQSRRERRQVLVAHGVVAIVLLVAAGVALLPGAAGMRRGSRALDAYEEAMSRLQSRGAQHRAELQRLGEELADTAALARSGQLAAGIAHEVRNGLGTILTQARLLESAGGEAAVAEASAAIRAECETLESVIRRFVDFVREEKLERADFDLGRLLGRVVAREGRARDDVAVDVDAEAVRIHADEDLLERGLENLVRNALEAAETRVAVSATVSGGQVEIRIVDDGPGLPEGGEPLRPFATSKAGGLGLGLPLALKVVQLHGGTLDLSPRASHGLEVRVRLPAEPGATGSNDLEPEGPSSGQPSPESKSI